MIIKQAINNGVATLSLSGRFYADGFDDFRKGYTELLSKKDIQSLDVDFGRVEFMDPSAIAMLLLLKHRATLSNVSLRLTRCTGAVSNLMKVANLGKVFILA